MKKICIISQFPFEISQADIDLYEKLGPTINGRKYPLPLPTLSPLERLRRRWAFRNEHALYSNTCSKTKKPVIAMFPPSLPITIYNQRDWWDKSWDGTEYGRDFDFSRSFFEQFAELLRSVPHPNLLNDALSNENSDYVNCTIELKNCYMIADAGRCQDCYYSNIINGSKNCVDCSAIVDCELGYELISSLNCYNCKFVINSEYCRDSAFLYACKSCSNCFGCFNLRHKEYCWYNEQLTKDEYLKRLCKLDLGNYDIYQQLKSDFLTKLKVVPREYAFQTNNENCTGNFLVRSHNVHDAFDSDSNEDSAYTISTTHVKDSMDIEHSYHVELSLEIMAATNIYQNFYSFYTINSQNIFYSYLASGSNNCFGCAGIKNQQYCILNRKYTKEKYEELVGKIIEHMEKTGEWGQFFPMSVSLHGYNESLAMDYFPLTQAESKKYGANWSEYEQDPTPGLTAVKAHQLPLSIKESDDSILNTAIVCEVSGKLFRITKQELQFYKSNNIPLPRRSSTSRYLDRLALRLPRMLQHRQCDCHEAHGDHEGRCLVSFESPYQLNGSEKVYCEKCYQTLLT
jgi:hypothetical protein